MSSKQKTRIVSIVGTIIIGLMLSWVYLEVQERNTRRAQRNIKQASKPTACGKFVHIKMGEYQFKVPGDQKVHLYKERKTLYNCEGSHRAKPKDVDELRFVLNTTIEDYGPLSLNVKISHAQQTESEIESAAQVLTENGKTIDTLPLQGGFHRYEAPNSDVSTYFKRLSDEPYDFLTLQSCSDEDKALSCSASFKWTPDIRVNISIADLDTSETHEEQKVPLDIWLKIHQAVTDNLIYVCLLYTSPSPRDRTRSRMPSSA